MTGVALEKSAIRRLSWRLLPFLMACYFVAYLDRANLGFAALHMNGDLGFSPAVYGLGASIFFVSYFLFEVPSNLLLERVGAPRWIGALMICWGLISMAGALVTTPLSFYAVRFALGAAEAGFFPGILLFLSRWFPRARRGHIISLFMVAQPLSLFAGSPLSGALLGLGGWLSLRGWQWLFLLEGMPALLLGAAFMRLMADRPSGAKWLPAAELEWLTARLREDGALSAARPPVWEVMRHPRVLLLGLVYAGSVMTEYGLAYWQPSMIKDYGLSDINTGLLNAIPYFCAAVAMILWGGHSDRRHERVWHVALPLLLAGVGLAGCLFLTALPLKLVCLCLTLMGCFSVKPPFWAFAFEALPPGYGTVAVAQINSMAILTGLVGPWAIGWLHQTTGNFTLALVPLLALACISGLSALLLRKPQIV